MRMMLKVSIPVEAGNKSIVDGTLRKTVKEFILEFEPEAAYFVADAGLRIAHGIFLL